MKKARSPYETNVSTAQQLGFLGEVEVQSGDPTSFFFRTFLKRHYVFFTFCVQPPTLAGTLAHFAALALQAASALLLPLPAELRGTLFVPTSIRATASEDSEAKLNRCASRQTAIGQTLVVLVEDFLAKDKLLLVCRYKLRILNGVLKSAHRGIFGDIHDGR